MGDRDRWEDRRRSRSRSRSRGEGRERTRTRSPASGSRHARHGRSRSRDRRHEGDGRQHARRDDDRDRRHAHDGRDDRGGERDRRREDRGGRDDRRDERRDDRAEEHERRRRDRSEDDGRRPARRQEEEEAGRAPSRQQQQQPGRDRERYADQLQGRPRSPPPPPHHPGGVPHRRAEPPLSDAPPAPGSIHQGTVHTIKPFGIFIAIPGYRRHVLVHHSQIADDVRFEKDDDNDTRVKAIDWLFPKGTGVWVKITAVEPDERSGELRVNGSMKAVSQADGSDLDPGGALAAGPGPQRDEPPEEGSVHRATVKRIEAYGVFVQLEGYRKHGLVHSSQVSNYLSFTREDTDEEKKAELAGVVSVGDVVFVKVVQIGEDDGSGRGPKIGCSIKLVDQTTGEDLDPNGLRYKPRGEGGAEGRQGAPALGANAGAVVKGRIDWGHLAGDNRLYVGDHKGEYSLLEDDKPAKGPAQQQQQQQLPPPPPLPSPGAGRGRGLVLPAWVTEGSRPGAPGSAPPAQGPRTVEEALAIIEQHNKQKKASKDKKHKKDKEKKSKHKKHKKQKKESKKEDSGTSSSDSG